VIIPYQSLSADALRGILEEFVNREGTDYGENEWSFEDKLESLWSQLKAGDIVVVFDQASETTGLVAKQDLALLDS